MTSNVVYSPMSIDSMALIDQESTPCSCLVSSLSSITIYCTSLLPKSHLDV